MIETPGGEEDEDEDDIDVDHYLDNLENDSD
jgi:hypothetical protein